MERAPNTKKSVLFTDASLKGWGAILVTADQQLHVTGSAWTFRASSGDISALEAAAVTNAVNAFEGALSAASRDGELEIVVDNTSVQAALQRGVARSIDLNENIRPALEKLQKLRVHCSTRHFRSEENPADSVSRGQSPDAASTRAVAANLRRGGGEATLVAVSATS